ncbi:inward rectifier potassium channel 13-like [Lethenteron reissneri]|uniref:inward rectifier potassium channel 13-like n=1 Tax=Lethenteron reissneri TaxID=7753 RepID=UPI002AB76C42|nr:inward rectifier potassium channel 13-like [Lethenteron reissneri]
MRSSESVTRPSRLRRLCPWPWRPAPAPPSPGGHRPHGVPGGGGGGRLIGRDGSSRRRWAPRGPRAALRRLGDLWTWLLELRWGLVLLAFAASFTLSWLLFGLAWYALALLHGDLGPPPPSGAVCVQRLTGLLAAFSFALETQLTVGYGAMHPDPEACPAAAALLGTHMVLGLMLDAFMTGAFVAKMARPKPHTGTIRLSDVAVVCWGGRGGERRRRRLAFRVANLRPSALLDVAVSAVLYRSRPGRPLRQSAVDFWPDQLGARPWPYFLFPLTFHHELGPDSPLLPLLLREPRWPDEHVELAVFLQATCEGSGTVCRQRTSYLRSEVLAGRLFAPIDVDVERGVVDLSLFDVTVAEVESGV